MRRLAALACGALAAAAPPLATNRPLALARLDGFVQGMTRAGQFAGVVLVAEGDRVVFEHAYGDRDAPSGQPATTDTRYNLASAGKMFTTVAVLQQVARGRLTLDTRVGEVLTDYPNRDFAAKVTVRQLLTHTAGAGDIDLFGVEGAANRATVRTVADVIALHGARPPAFEPGSTQDYGNYGFVVLGRMVEILSGERYEAYVARHILAPAGMTRTGFVDCVTSAPDIAVGYATVDGKRVRNCATQPARGMPAGGQLSTARDMFRFVQALRRGRLVPLSLLAEATKPYRTFMGLGFFATDYGKDVPKRDFRWGHGGSSDGACTDVRFHPETGETIVVLANTDPPGCYPVAGFLHAAVRTSGR